MVKGSFDSDLENSWIIVSQLKFGLIGNISLKVIDDLVLTSQQHSVNSGDKHHSNTLTLH